MARYPRQQLYIDGAYVEASGGDVFESVNPATGESWARMPAASTDDVNRAVSAAKNAPSAGLRPHNRYLILGTKPVLRQHGNRRHGHRPGREIGRAHV